MSNTLSSAPTASAEPTASPAAGDESHASFQALLGRPRQSALPNASAVVLGTLVAFDSQGHPLVSWPGQGDAASSQASQATSLVALAPEQLGQTVALSFPSSSVQPLILGVVWQPPSPTASHQHQDIQAEADGEIYDLQGQHVQLEGQESVTLRCGKASITLTADGQILLRGAYINSHSSGTQRIKGAAVRIN
jgi:Domain of unknown function (DUF6484)